MKLTDYKYSCLGNFISLPRENYFPAQGDKITSEEIFTYIRPISDYIGCKHKFVIVSLFSELL